MLEIGSIKLTTICYITEDPIKVQSTLSNLIPEKYRETKPNKTIITSQFNDKLILYDFDFEGEIAVECIKYLSDQLTHQEKTHINGSLDDRIDFEDRSIHFRLNKFKACDEIIELDNGSDVIKMVIKYRSYTKNQNSMENVITTLKELGLLE